MRSFACMLGAIALLVALAVCLGGCELNPSPESVKHEVFSSDSRHIVWRLKNIESKLDQVIAAQKAAMPAEKPTIIKRANDSRNSS